MSSQRKKSFIAQKSNEYNSQVAEDNKYISEMSQKYSSGSPMKVRNSAAPVVKGLGKR